VGRGRRLDGAVDVGRTLDRVGADDLGRPGRVDGVERGHSCPSFLADSRGTPPNPRGCLKHLFQGYGYCNVYAMMVSAQIDAHLRRLTPAERRGGAVGAGGPEAVGL